MSCDALLTCLRAGDTSEDIVITRQLSDNSQALLNAGYTCHLEVENTSIDRAVATLRADNKAFITFITAAESGAMAPGETYTGLITLAHAASGYRRTQKILFEICC